MNPLLCLGMGGLFAGLIAGRVVAERAMRLLTDEEKLKLLDSFSGFRTYGAVPLLTISFLFYALSSFPAAFIRPGYFLGWGLLAAFIAWQHFYVHRRLVALGLPVSYRAAFARAQWCSRVGFLIAFLCITRTMFL